jgi:hypothetical protein
VTDWPIGKWCAGGQIDGVLDLVVQRYLSRSGEDIRAFFHDLIYFLFLCGEVSHRDPRSGCDISLILRENHKDDKLPHLRDDLPAFLIRDQGNNTRWDFLRYLVQFPIQSNNKTTRPRIIYNMTFP